MLSRIVKTRTTVVLCLLLFAPAAAHAQSRISTVPATSLRPPEPEETGPSDVTSGVSFIDSALPRTLLRTRVDLVSRIDRPTRSEFLFPAGGLPGTPGQPIPERRVDYQEVNTYLEYGLGPFFSLFLETPYRWVNPDFNDNTRGVGDLNLGLKLIIFHDESFFATFQFRGYLPSGSAATGTDHPSIEPGLLAHWTLGESFNLEGELRYWVPLGGTDFAGEVLRYGVGLTYGQRHGGYWATPVIEAVGWSVLDGKALAVTTPSSFFIENVAGDTIFNVNAGLRLGWGEHIDIYAGYSRAIGGHVWYKDLIRVEFRWLF